jgi:hypothetical protein
MLLRTAAVEATDDQGNRIGGPYALPLSDEAKRELKQLMREYGPITGKDSKSGN